MTQEPCFCVRMLQIFVIYIYIYVHIITYVYKITWEPTELCVYSIHIYA